MYVDWYSMNYGIANRAYRQNYALTTNNMCRKDYLRRNTIFLLFFVALSISCNSKKDYDSNVKINSVDTEIDNDSSTVSSMDDYDWTPKEFKNEHHDEWVVVKQSINIQQREKEIYLNEIDGLVKEYIRKKKITLPADKYQQIRAIEDICVTKFDISGYDDSNMGMLIADDTSRLFEEYVNWLLAQEAKKIENTGINFEEEERMLKRVMDAYTSCCDTIGHKFQGTGGWMGYAYVYRIEKDFKKSMYVAVLNPQAHKVQPFLLTPQYFKEECETRILNYRQDDWYRQDGWADSPSPKTVKVLIDDYYNAMKQWLEYREGIERQISNSVLKADYAYITRSFAKEQYVHLKNVFGDIGICSASMCEVYLDLDCSDKEMLNYSYEKALAKYLNN